MKKLFKDLEVGTQFIAYGWMLCVKVQPNDCYGVNPYDSSRYNSFKLGGDYHPMNRYWKVRPDIEVTVIHEAVYSE